MIIGPEVEALGRNESDDGAMYRCLRCGLEYTIYDLRWKNIKHGMQVALDNGRYYHPCDSILLDKLVERIAAIEKAQLENAPKE